MAHLSLVPKQEMTDDLSLSNKQRYQEQGIDDQVSNNDAYEDTNLVFISQANQNQDLGFEFEDVETLDLLNTAGVEENVLFTGEEDQLTTVSMDRVSSAGTHYKHKMNPRTRSQKKYISNPSSTINDEKSFQSKSTARSIASSSSFLSTCKKRPHEVQKQFECNWPECNPRLSNACNARRHERAHTGAKPYICDWKECGKGFSYSNSLTDHKRTHTGEKPYICDWPNCGQGFTQRTNLNTHKMKHTGQKSFLCDWADCKRRFTSRSDLITRKRIHTGEKPYVCDWPDCKKQFRRSDTLNNHKRIHTFENSFICSWPDCNLQFNRSCVLNRHSRIHTVEKPYVCDYPDCNGQQRFTNLGGLNRHKRAHNNVITPEQCDQDIVKVELDPFELDSE